jgi:hypothetical protein
MATKCTGAELFDFFQDDSQWPEGRYLEEIIISVNGESIDDSNFNHEALKPEDECVLEYGYLRDANDDSIDLTKAFSKWKKKRTTAYVTLSVDVDKRDELLEWLKKAPIQGLEIKA